MAWLKQETKNTEVQMLEQHYVNSAAATCALNACQYSFQSRLEHLQNNLLQA